MPLNDEDNVPPNVRLGSNTYEYRLVKMRAHPQGTGQPPEGSAYSRRRRQRRALRQPVQVTMTYVGGPEGSIVFRQNGFSWRYSSGDALLDVLLHWLAVKP